MTCRTLVIIQSGKFCWVKGLGKGHETVIVMVCRDQAPGLETTQVDRVWGERGVPLFHQCCSAFLSFCHNVYFWSFHLYTTQKPSSSFWGPGKLWQKSETLRIHHQQYFAVVVPNLTTGVHSRTEVCFKTTPAVCFFVSVAGRSSGYLLIIFLSNRSRWKWEWLGRRRRGGRSGCWCRWVHQYFVQAVCMCLTASGLSYRRSTNCCPVESCWWLRELKLLTLVA